MGGVREKESGGEVRERRSEGTSETERVRER